MFEEVVAEVFQISLAFDNSANCSWSEALSWCREEAIENEAPPDFKNRIDCLEPEYFKKILTQNLRLNNNQTKYNP